MCRWILVFLLVLAVPAAAQMPYYVSNGGDEYEISHNANGAVLTSVYPKAWFIEGGANSRVVRGRTVFYFGKSCDVFHEVFGQGTWGWANGGFGAEFESFRLMFPRQEIDVDGMEKCRW